MTPATIDLFGASASGLHPVGERIALWFSDAPAKVIAREFAVAVQTAKGWKRGQLPLMAHFAAMVARWGEDFLDFVFAPALADAPSLSQRLERMEKRAAQFSRELADLKQQVTHEALVDWRGPAPGADRPCRAVGADGGGAGSVARSARAIGAALLVVILAGPVLDVVAPPAYATVLDLAEDDDDHAARLHKVARRPLRAGSKREAGA